jgi:rhodanese-related sulfurtransferase
MPKTIESMLAEANALVHTLAVDEARALLGRDDVVFVDLRDPRELDREGRLPGAFSAPRGMLEFWVDPASPYHKPVFNQPDKRYVLFCAGGWRSALAAQTMMEMGVAKVSHLGGGFSAWKAAGAPVA